MTPESVDASEGTSETRPVKSAVAEQTTVGGDPLAEARAIGKSLLETRAPSSNKAATRQDRMRFIGGELRQWQASAEAQLHRAHNAYNRVPRAKPTDTCQYAFELARLWIFVADELRAAMLGAMPEDIRRDPGSKQNFESVLGESLVQYYTVARSAIHMCLDDAKQHNLKSPAVTECGKLEARLPKP